MNWFNNLPLEKISESLAAFFIWWANLTEGFPENQLPLVVYMICATLILVLWMIIMRLIPRPFKGMSWMAFFAVLFAPGQAAGGTGEIAPAMLGVFHAILMKDFAGAVTAFLPILAVFVGLLFIGAIWQMLRSVIAGDEAKKLERQRIQEEKQKLAQQS